LAASACISSSQYVIRISLYIAAALARYCRAGSRSPQRRWSSRGRRGSARAGRARRALPPAL